MANLDQIMDYVADAMTVEDVAVTYTATTGKITSVECKKYGKIVHMRIVGNNIASTSAGTNLFAGTISCDCLPAITAQSCAYSSGVAFPSSLTSAGALVVRSCATGSLSSGVSVGASFVYITE